MWFSTLGELKDREKEIPLTVKMCFSPQKSIKPFSCLFSSLELGFLLFLKQRLGKQSQGPLLPAAPKDSFPTREAGRNITRL